MTQKRILALIKGGGIVVWFMLANTITSIIASWCVRHLGIAPEAHVYLFNLLSQLICLAGVLIVCRQIITTKPIEIAVWQTLKPLKYMVWGIGAWLICTLINALLFPFFPEYEEIGALFTSYEPVLRFIVLVIGAPLVEEYLFRGQIQGYLKGAFGVTFAIVVQAVLFGGLHGLSLQQIYATAMGLIFGIVREREGNFSATVMMHMTVNLIGWGFGTFL